MNNSHDTNNIPRDVCHFLIIFDTSCLFAKFLRILVATFIIRSRIITVTSL